MKSLSEIVLNFFELLEAEGRLFREKTISAGAGIVSILIGGLFLLAACIIASAAAYIYLSSLYGQIAAMLTISAALALIGIILIASGKR